MSRKRRIYLWIAGGLAALTALTLLALYEAAQHEPAFYREALETAPEVLEAASDKMLQQATAFSNEVQREGRWEAVFTAEQINGWLAVDRVKNFPNIVPPMMQDPRVEITPNGITVACRCEKGGVTTVSSLTVLPYTPPESNAIALRILRFRAGLLPLPRSEVLDGISQAVQELQQNRDVPIHLEWKQSEGDPVALFSPSTDKNESPPVTIETIRLGNGEIYVAGTTTKKP
jgi:hypothetical protein